MEAVSKCASLVAYLEGCHNLSLPVDAGNLAVGNIHKRIVALERAIGIASPPPMDAASWNGLVWRTWQARSHSARLYVGQVAVRGDIECHAAMVEDEDCSLASLWRLVDGLDTGSSALHRRTSKGGTEAYAGGSPPHDEAECLAAMIQTLAYIAGSLRRPFPDYRWTRALIYAYAADVSFVIANSLRYTHGFNAPVLPPPGMRQGPMVPPGRPVVGGGFEKKRTVSRTPSSGRSFRNFFGGKRQRRSTWLGRLLFWRSGKTRVDSDSSSCSSREVID